MLPCCRYLVRGRFGTQWHELTALSSVTGALSSSLPVGINPFWKLSFVFKCLTDSVVLDDFKTALDRLRAFKINHFGSFAVENGENGPVTPPMDSSTGLHTRRPMPPPDADELSHPRFWSGARKGRNHVDAPNRSNQGSSHIKQSPSDAEARRNASDSAISRPHSSWLRDSTELDYAQAVREVTGSKHVDRHHTEKDNAVGRAK